MISEKSIKRAAKKHGWTLRRFNNGAHLRINSAMDFWPATQMCMPLHNKRSQRFKNLAELAKMVAALPQQPALSFGDEPVEPARPRRSIGEIQQSAKRFWGFA